MTSRNPIRPALRRTALLANCTLLAGCAVLAGCSAATTPSGPPTPAATPAAVVPTGTAGTLAAARSATLQAPGDPGAWTALAFTALEFGRASGDPALYAEADAAASRSLAIRPQDNDSALAARALLAAADHDFATARTVALQALAVNPASTPALSALTDGLTGLGRFDEALAAAQRLDAVSPGVASFTRLSYQAELRGDVDRARTLLQRAAQVAATPGEFAFARAQDGLLALTVGDVEGAARTEQDGAAAVPSDLALEHLAARVAVARGDLADAASRYAAIVDRLPSPAYATEQAEVLIALGDRAGAATALDLARAGYALQTSAGVRAEGVQVLFEADHGDPAAAVRLGREVWQRSPTPDHADALAWALHRAGDDRAAAEVVDRAFTLGGATPAFHYHRGVIRAAVGDRRGARSDLTTALAATPSFSPVDAPAARRALEGLGR